MSKINAQYIVGANSPSSKALVFDLGSVNKQGVMFPKVSDTAFINTLNPPIGTIIFYNGIGPYSNKLLLRDVSGWKRIVADFLEANRWVNAGPIQISASLLSPLKPTVVEVDKVEYKIIDDEWAEVMYSYMAQDPTGSTRGEGDYIFTLPAGLKFDITAHPLFTIFGDAQTILRAGVIRFIVDIGVGGLTSQGAGAIGVEVTNTYCVPFTDNSFRILTVNGTTTAIGPFMRGGHHSFNNPSKVIRIFFKMRYRN